MSSFKLSTILCSFLILQAQALPQNHYPNKAHVNDIIDTITGIVTTVENEVDRTLDDINTKLDKFIENPEPLEKSLQGLFGKIVDSILDWAETQLNQIKENGNADTKLIVGCFQTEEDKFKSLVLATFVKNSKCLVAELVTFHKSLRSIVGDLQEVQSDVKESLAKLDRCPRGNLEAIVCALGIARDTIEVAKEIPEITSEDVNNLIEIVKAFPKSLKSCVKPNADVFRADMVEVIDNISTCSRK